MKRLLSTLLALTMALALVSCGKSNPTPNTGSNKTETPSETADTKTEGNVHIGIVTGSVSQSEDDRRGAEAFQALYGEDMVKLAIYPDNFTEELETTIQTIVNLADDADMKAIIVNQSVPGTTEAFRKIKEIRPDILCIAGEAHEDLLEIGSAADLVCNNDFVARGYLIIRTAHELGCDTFVHISFPRHLAYETMSRRIAVMKAACEEFGMKFVMETAPDPTSDVGVAGAQAYILEKVPEWSKTYGEKAAYFCTNDAHTEPLLKQLLQYGGYFIEATAGLAQHALNVINGESELCDIDDIAKAYHEFSPEASWNGSNYTNATTGVKADNTFLVYQDTYIMGDPGWFMGSTSVEVPEKYFTVK